MCEFDIVDGTQDWHFDPSGSLRTKVGEEEMCLDSSSPPPPPPPPCVSLPDKTVGGYQSPRGGNYLALEDNVVWDMGHFNAAGLFDMYSREDYVTFRTTVTSTCSYDIEYEFMGRSPGKLKIVAPGTGVPFDAENLQPRTTTVEQRPPGTPLVGHRTKGRLVLNLRQHRAHRRRAVHDLLRVDDRVQISHLPDGCVSLKSEWSSEVDKSRAAW